MITRSASAQWKGNLKEGDGNLKLDSGAWSGPYSFKTRFEDQQGTNPEELIAAAHAGCYSMALAHVLGEAGYRPKRIETTANVQLSEDKAAGGFSIDLIRLMLEAEIPEIKEGEFEKLATQAKESCPVSKALAGPSITLETTLRQ